jgi:menaquinone-dependent protoporphyrinogen oxidase
MAEAARAIGRTLRQRGYAATVARPEDVRSIDAYDAVVVGSGVYGGRWLKQARKLIARGSPALATRPVWLFSSGSDGQAPTAEVDPADIAAIRKMTDARDHRVFTGELAEKGLHFAEWSPRGSDERHLLDRPAIEGWANEIADALNASAAA